MPRQKVQSELGELNDALDAVHADRNLRTLTIDDFVSMREGKLTKEAVYENLARRAEAVQRVQHAPRPLSPFIN